MDGLEDFAVMDVLTVCVAERGVGISRSTGEEKTLRKEGSLQGLRAIQT